MNRKIWHFSLMLSGCLLIMTSSCSKKSDNTDTNLPVLGTTTTSAITETTAMSGGNITSIGGAAVIASGICWSLSANPTLIDSKTIDGALTGSFASKLTGLTGNTLYYVRAYATNSMGTGYGDQKSFTTAQPVIPAFSVTSTTVPIQDGGKGLQFFAKCLNDDIKMTKVNMTDPTHGALITYNYVGQTYVANELFGLQDDMIAYPKEIGTWKFEFIGNRSITGKAFDITTTLAITNK